MMNILMAASEMAPFVGTGEMADAVAGLAGQLKRQGQDVSVVVPYYRAIREGKAPKPKKTSFKFSVSVGAAKLPCEIFETKSPDGVRVFLVARDEFFDRSGLYGTDDRDYQDNAARFVYFTKCALELARRLDPQPQIVHAHSWEAALAPVLSRDLKLPFRTVLTPHSLEYQGNFWSYDFSLTNLPGDYFSAKGVEYYGSMNCLKAGILYADAVVLPSERFVIEAQTPEYGCGLENVLREYQHKLSGIPMDLSDWKPSPTKNRAALLAATDFQPDAAAIYAVLAESSKSGAGELLSSLDRLLADNVRVVLLGAVPEEHTISLEVARRKHRGRFVHLNPIDDNLARTVLRGVDAVIVPGPLEPGDFWLKRALREGCVPIAAHCAGLFSLVRDWEASSGTGNGFVYSSLTVDGLVDACRRAQAALSDRELWGKLEKRCRAADFSVAAAASDYVELYERILGGNRQAKAA